ncbi:MAG TPA: trehalose-6-phosphate synthase, partial [Candidatus Xenobia bacterium]
MRLIVVSNRLPTLVKWEGQHLRLEGTAGGLTSGLGAWLGRLRDAGVPYRWVGWPGATVVQARQAEVRAALEEHHQAVPVFLGEVQMEQFYLGFCNSTLWPLFHYFQSFVVYEPAHWETWQEVNQIFCDVLADLLEPGDVVWIHDYHLMLLPRLLRERVPECTIGFFLHVPFPSFEVFRLLPTRWRMRLLEGLLGADLVGFHTHDYTQHFLKCVGRMLGLEASLGAVVVDGRMVRADTFPMGIDYEYFSSLASSPAVREETPSLLKGLKDVKVVLSVDRLDYSKGIPQRLQAFALLLERYPDWQGKVSLALVVVPSRIGIHQY